MFVELLGLPASGKSTLFKQCKATLTEAGYSVAAAPDLDDKDTNLPGYFRRNPVTRVVYRMEQFRAENPKSIALVEDFSKGSQGAKALLYSAAVRQKIYRENPNLFDIVLIDEGCLHRAVHLILNSAAPSEPLLEAFCEVVPLPDAVIYLKLPPDLSFARSLDRLSARAGDRQSPEQLAQRIKSAHGSVETLQNRTALMEHALDRVSKRGCEVFRVDSQDVLECVNEQVCDQLRKLVPTPNGRTRAY